MGEAAEAIANYDPLNEEHVREAFLQDIAVEAKRADALTEAYGRAPEAVHDETTAAKLTDLAKQIGVCAKAIEAKRKTHKGRYDICGGAIQAAAKAKIDNLTTLKRHCEDRLGAYQRRIAEAERKRREEEALKAAAEAAKKEAELQTEDDLDEAIRAGAEAERARQEAAARPADLHKDRGEFGSVASLRSVLAFEITSIEAIQLDTIRRYIPRDAIEKAIRAYMREYADTVKQWVKDGKGEQFLAGVRFFEDQQTRVR